MIGSAEESHHGQMLPRRKSQRTLNNIMPLLHNYARLFGLESGHAIKKVQQSAFGVSCDLRTPADTKRLKPSARHAQPLSLVVIAPCESVLLSQLNVPARLKFKTPDLSVGAI